MAKAKNAKNKEATVSKNKLVDDFNKKFGEGTFFTFNDAESSKVETIPFGIPSVDYASGIGGVGKGRIVEIYGPESSGKTTISLMLAAKAQEDAKNPNSPNFGKRVAFIDAEHALDPVHVAALGVDVSSETGMLINQPDSGEQAYDLMEAICASDQFCLCIVDSLAALVPLKEAENSMDYNPIGLQARMNSQGLRKLKGPAVKHNVPFVFINQLRMNAGQMFGNPEVTPGGKALKFYASMRIDVRRKEIKKNDVFLGQTITCTFKKNKLARPFTKAEFDYYWVGGVDLIKDIMLVAIETEVINRGGAWYFIGEDKDNVLKDGQGNELRWMGKDATLEALRNSPSLFRYIDDLVQGKIPKGTQFVVEDYEDETFDEEAVDVSEVVDA